MNIEYYNSQNVKSLICDIINQTREIRNNYINIDLHEIIENIKNSAKTVKMSRVYNSSGGDFLYEPEPLIHFYDDYKGREIKRKKESADAIYYFDSKDRLILIEQIDLLKQELLFNWVYYYIGKNIICLRHQNDRPKTEIAIDIIQYINEKKHIRYVEYGYPIQSKSTLKTIEFLNVRDFYFNQSNTEMITYLSYVENNELIEATVLLEYCEEYSKNWQRKWKRKYNYKEAKDIVYNTVSPMLNEIFK